MVGLDLGRLRDVLAEGGGAVTTSLVRSLTLVAMFLLAFVAFFVAKQLLQRVVGTLVKKTETYWDDVLLESRFFFWLAQLAPGVVLYATAEPMLGEPENWVTFIQQASVVYMVVVGYLAIASLLNGGQPPWLLLR